MIKKILANRVLDLDSFFYNLIEGFFDERIGDLQSELKSVIKMSCVNSSLKNKLKELIPALFNTHLGSIGIINANEPLSYRRVIELLQVQESILVFNYNYISFDISDDRKIIMLSNRYSDMINILNLNTLANSTIEIELENTTKGNHKYLKCLQSSKLERIIEEATAEDQTQTLTQASDLEGMNNASAAEYHMQEKAFLCGINNSVFLVSKVGRGIEKFVFSDDISNICVSNDGRMLTANTDLSETHVFNIEEGKLLMKIQHGITTFGFIKTIFSPDNQNIASALNNVIKITRIYNQEELMSISLGDLIKVVNIKYSPKGTYLVAVTNQGDIIQINLKNKLSEKIYGHELTDVFSDAITVTGYVEAIEFSSNDNYLATGATDNKTIIWDLKKMEKVFEISHDLQVEGAAAEDQTQPLIQAIVKSIDFSENNNYVVSASSNGVIQLMALNSLNTVKQIVKIEPSASIKFVKFVENDLFIVFGYFDKASQKLKVVKKPVWPYMPSLK